MDDIYLLPKPEEKTDFEEAVILSEGEAAEAEAEIETKPASKGRFRAIAELACFLFLAISVFCAAQQEGLNAFIGTVDKNIIAVKVLKSFLYRKPAADAAFEETGSNDGESTNSPNSDWFNDKTGGALEDPYIVTITNENIYNFDASAIPEGFLPIIPYNLTQESDGVLRISNETGYTPDLLQLISAETANYTNLTFSPNEPVVLIIHTHGTEAFSKEGVNYYSDNFNVPRSSDITENIVYVGSAMAQVLNSNGVPTLHCQIMHDLESYKDSYSRSSQTIQEYLKEYPSIKYIFDVHRDSVLSSSSAKIRPVTVINDKATAQVMTVVGTDFYGAYHPDWQKNLTLAAKLQASLNANYLNFARSINLRGAAFNQYYTTGSLLLEIGSCGNTIEEAKLAGELVAKELAKLILNGW